MTDKEHAQNFTFLTGKTIASVRYMTEKECEDFMWSKRPLIIRFTDGSYLIPQMDDEGNNGGAMTFGGADKQSTIYTL